MPVPVDPAVSARLAQFQDAFAREAKDEALVDEFVLHGTCYALPDAVHFDVKKRISVQFDVDIHTEIFVVGSGKLGFSVAPSKRWRACRPSSDIDVAIVSHSLYQRVWHEVRDYEESGADWPKRAEFYEYHSRGWLRPDMAPPSPVLVMGDIWWEFFRELKALRLAGARKINAGVYHDMHMLKSYQAISIAKCREDLASAN